MSERSSFLLLTELDETTMPALHEQMARVEMVDPTPRSYPGYPAWPLDRVRPRWRKSLDRALLDRQCARWVSEETPSRKSLSRLLQYSHGVTRGQCRGATPSAGGLQALELYFVHWNDAWLPRGLYHYDRMAHRVSQISAEATRPEWRRLIPSLTSLDGGAIMWVLVGDEPRVAAKYLDRAARFLLLEAGHLMQNLCLVSVSLGLTTVPLGGCLDREIAEAFQLPSTDWVLYTGVCGRKL